LNLPEFMRDFQSSVARELNRLHGREGKFFERRYSSEQVLDDESATFFVRSNNAISRSRPHARPFVEVAGTSTLAPRLWHPDFGGSNFTDLASVPSGTPRSSP
jgi:hypothetical protein